MGAGSKLLVENIFFTSNFLKISQFSRFNRISLADLCVLPTNFSKNNKPNKLRITTNELREKSTTPFTSKMEFLRNSLTAKSFSLMSHKYAFETSGYKKTCKSYCYKITSTAIKTFKPLLFYLRRGIFPEGDFPGLNYLGVIFRDRTIFRVLIFQGDFFLRSIFPDIADDITVLSANPNRILSLKNTIITVLKKET